MQKPLFVWVSATAQDPFRCRSTAIRWESNCGARGRPNVKRTRVGARICYDNLATLTESRRELEPVPAYWTVRRFLKAHGLVRRPRRRPRNTAGRAWRGVLGGAQLRSRMRRRSAAQGLPSCPSGRVVTEPAARVQ